MTPKQQREALQYNLSSLILLQDKHQENIVLFETFIKKEREGVIFDKTIQSTLEDRLRLHKSNTVPLNDADVELIKQDLPKILSNIERRAESVKNLQSAILNEQEQMDREEQMITFLVKRRDSKE